MYHKIDTIVFDLGGVLIDWNPRRLFRKIFDTETEIDYFLENICTMDWNEQQDAGRSTAAATLLLVDQFPDYRAAIEAYYGRWEEMLGGAIQGTVAIFEQLHNANQYPIYALTNWSSETFPIAQARFEFLQWFKGILVSGDEKLKKPDPKIYQLLTQRYNINPLNSIFIDDSLRNIKAAQALGFHAIHFVGAEDLKRQLIGLGIMSDASK